MPIWDRFSNASPTDGTIIRGFSELVPNFANSMVRPYGFCIFSEYSFAKLERLVTWKITVIHFANCFFPGKSTGYYHRGLETRKILVVINLFCELDQTCPTVISGKSDDLLRP